MIDSAEEACEQVLKIIFDKKVNTAHGTPISLDANTVCIHGDGPNAIEITKALHECLKNQHLTNHVKSKMFYQVHLILFWVE